ncbi:MAG: helix-turn-helix transcriptional regulator [Alphaproteobacteria bacterium]|nr:helix-turn-helix transcriptional regulator [Alphaproteobacteria bacterium]
MTGTSPSISQAPAIGGLIQRWRKGRRLSQLDLALESGISARHLSFIETGRTRPSRDMVLRLCGVLAVPLRDRNNLLLAAGFAPVYRETALDAPEMAEIISAVRMILRRHEPYPAVAFDVGWDIVMANTAYAGMVNALLPAGHAQLPALALVEKPRPNILRMLCRPEGARNLLANWEETTRAVLARARREVLRDGDAGRRALLAEVSAYPGVPGPDPRELDGAQVGLVVPVEIRTSAGTQRLLSTIATLGTAEDITLQELRIESFHPVEDAAA